MIKRKYYTGTISKSTAKYIALTSLLLSTAFLSGCHSDDETRSFDISVRNVTANQPLSPIGVVLHKTGYHAWIDGQAASVSLEHLAEGGDNSALITDANAIDTTLQATSGAQPVGPGGSTQFQLSINNETDIRLTLFSMLVNTNDAYTGINAAKLSDLTVGQSLSLSLPAWDSGTEANSEAQGTMPGPADGGEGFNANRDDFLDLVGIHRGVLSSDDGLASSILNQSHRFDNPVMQVRITRTQ
ncbi:MAG: spondin domain-containing protein [Thiotrichaceae bacterium]